MTLCDRCEDPGFCCRKITLSGQGPPLGASRLEALVWAATVQPASRELGIPFIPDHEAIRPFPFPHRTCPLPEWQWSCINLQADGRCGDYDNRPKLCRIFIAGYERPCAMFGRNTAPCDLLLKIYENPDIVEKDLTPRGAGTVAPRT